jgi:hypothetical protein
VHWIQDAEDVRRLLDLLSFVTEYGEVTRDQAAGELRESERLINTALLAGTLRLAHDGRMQPTRPGRDLVALYSQGNEELASRYFVLRLPFYRQHFLLHTVGSSQSQAEALAWVRAWLSRSELDRHGAQRQVLQALSRRFLRGISEPTAWRWLEALDTLSAPDRRRQSNLRYLSKHPVTIDLYAVVPRLAERGYKRFSFLDTPECARLYVLAAHVVADQLGCVVHIDHMLKELSFFREADLDVEAGWDRFDEYASYFSPMGVYLTRLPGTSRSTLLNPVDATLVASSDLGRLWRLLSGKLETPDSPSIIDYLHGRGVLTYDQAGLGGNRSTYAIHCFAAPTAEATSFAEWLSEGGPTEAARPVVLPQDLLTVETLTRLLEGGADGESPALRMQASLWGRLPVFDARGGRLARWDTNNDGREQVADLFYEHVPHALAFVSLLLLQHRHRTALTLRAKRGGRCWVVNEKGQKRALLETLDAALELLGCDVLREWRADGRTSMAVERSLVDWAIELELAMEEGGVLRIAPTYQESHTGGQRLAWWHAHEPARDRIWKMLNS